MIARISSNALDFWQRIDALSSWDEVAPDIESVVRGIIDDVRARGDEAVVELTNRFDRRSVAGADAGLKSELDSAGRLSLENIRRDSCGDRPHSTFLNISKNIRKLRWCGNERAHYTARKVGICRAGRLPTRRRC